MRIQDFFPYFKEKGRIGYFPMIDPSPLFEDLAILVVGYAVAVIPGIGAARTAEYILGIINIFTNRPIGL